MLKNYLAAAIRNLVRNRFYVSINVLGLAIAFAATTLIVLFVRDELTYDRYLPRSARICLLTETLAVQGQSPIVTPTSQSFLARQLKIDFRSIEQIARLLPATHSLRHGNFEANEKIYWADSNIFQVLPFPHHLGTLDGALRQPDGIVISQRVAQKYFNHENPIGQILEVDRQYPMQVTAVIDDLPASTHLDTEIIAAGNAPFSDLSVADANRNGAEDWSDSAYTYALLAPGTAVQWLNAELPTFMNSRYQMTLHERMGVTLQFVPVADVHMKAFTQKQMRPGGDWGTLQALAAVAVLVLIVAAVNFVNLMTARGARRAVEVGVRKAVGARRRDLVVQFIGESVLYALIAMLVCLLLVEWALPAFNAFLGRTMTLQYWRDWRMTGGLTVLALLVGMLAGAYPAFVLSSSSPVVALRSGATSSAGSGRIRYGLVILQFAILLVLIISTATIYRQARFATHEGLRLNTHQVLTVTGSCPSTFRDEVRKLAGVLSAACSNPHALNLDEVNYPFTLEDGSEFWLTGASVDLGFFDLYGIRPLAGRLFSIEHSDDVLEPDFLTRPPVQDLETARRNGIVPARVVLNEAAVRRMGLASAAAAIGRVFFGFGRQPLQVIGVVPDFSMDTIHKKVAPVVYGVFPPSFADLSIKLNGRDVPGTLAAIDLLWARLGDPKPITRFFLEEHLQSLSRDVTARAGLFAAFAAISVVIACLGLFAFSAFTAERRTREIGIRKAAGADDIDVVKLLIWQFAKPVLWANLIGWPLAAAAMDRWLSGFAYHVNLEISLFFVCAVLVLVIALLTVSIQTVIVARTDPAVTLRYE